MPGQCRASYLQVIYHYSQVWASRGREGQMPELEKINAHTSPAAAYPKVHTTGIDSGWLSSLWETSSGYWSHYIYWLANYIHPYTDFTLTPVYTAILMSLHRYTDGLHCHADVTTHVVLMDFTVILMSLHCYHWWTTPLYWWITFIYWCHYTIILIGYTTILMDYLT